jgi:hypothetical protein
VELISREQKRLARIPFNDFRYAGIVRSWLPYADRLFQERKDIRRGLDASTRLKNMRYDPLAIEIVLTKRWRSAVEFVCGWLAQRGGIEMVKQRKDSDSANTLRNSYTRVFGQKSTSSGH